MSSEEISQIKASVVEIQQRFADHITKLEAYAAAQQTSADASSKRMDDIERMMKEAHQRTQEQLASGEESISARLKEVSSFGDQVDKAMIRLNASIEAAGVAMTAKATANDQRLAQTEQKVAEALGGLTQAIDVIRTETQATAAAAAAATTTAAAASARAQEATVAATAVQAQLTGLPKDPRQNVANQPAPDPWQAFLSGSSGPPETGGGGGGGGARSDVGLKEKDFNSIDKFDGNMDKFPDWSDRISSKLRRAHSTMGELLKWAEQQPDKITVEVEENMSTSDLHVPTASTAIFDILLSKTTSVLFDKRKNAGEGRGLEFWRVLKQDYGMDSTDAQHARLQLFMRPARCATIGELGGALDKWEALGSQVGRRIDDDFKLIALKELVPKNLLDMINTQVQLKSYPEALGYVKKQVIGQRHVTQVAEVQRRARTGPTPMDIGTLVPESMNRLIAALERVAGTGGDEQERGQETEEECDAQPTESPLDTVIAALKGQGKGKKGGWRSQQPDQRICYGCGKKGHIQANCPMTQAAPLEGKGKGKGKGKWGPWSGKGVGSLEEDAPHAQTHNAAAQHAGPRMGSTSPGIRLTTLTVETSSLTSETPTAPTAPGQMALSTCARDVVYWGNYMKVEATLDSGAAECVCAPHHFPGAPVKEGAAHRAGVNYVCADGGKIPNMGEKEVYSISTEGMPF